MGRRPGVTAPHIPVESAKRYVDLISADKILQEGKRAFDEATTDGRPKSCTSSSSPNPTARTRRTFKRTRTSRWATRPRLHSGEASSSPPARELREGVMDAAFSTASPDTILAMLLDVLFDFAGVHIIGDKAVHTDLRIDFAFTDIGETWTVWVKRGVLNARLGASPDTQLTVSGPKAALVGIIRTLDPDTGSFLQRDVKHLVELLRDQHDRTTSR